MVEHLINLDSYPLHRPQSAQYRSVVEESAARLTGTGLLNLEGFLTPEGTELLVGEVNRRMPEAMYAVRQDNPYGAVDSEGAPEDHPYKIFHPTSRYGLAYHQLRDTLLDELYRWPPLRQFVADVTGNEVLYLHEDPSNALVLQIYRTGDTLAWHFDQALFSTVLNLSETESGGAFECVPNIRSETDPCFDAVRDVLNGTSDRVEQHFVKAGSFSIMLGRYSLHRVSRVEGPTPRMSMILSYEDRPGVTMDVATRKMLFGAGAPDTP